MAGKKAEIVQFNPICIGTLPIIDVNDLSKAKKLLQSNGLIGTLQCGEYKGYDYGNISMRCKQGILISGTQTSGKSDVMTDDFALITDYDEKRFEVNHLGTTKPSSEAPIHLSAYDADKRINAVVHCHIVEYSRPTKVFGIFFMVE